MPHRPVSAAEKYAELEALGLERPKCGCHGLPKGWMKHPGCLAGGYWFCRRNELRHLDPEKERARNALYRTENAEKIRVAAARRRAENSEKEKARHARYRAANPEKVRAASKRRNARRVRIFGESISMPDLDFAEFARRMRDERKAALKEAS